MGGQLGGWEPGTLTVLGDGQYEADGPVGHDYFGEVANGGNGLPYSTLELYLMGLISASGVTQDINKAEDPAWVDSSQGIFTAASITTYSIDDIISQYGARSPDYLSSQKNFTMLLVLVSDTPPVYNDYQEARESLSNFSLIGDDGNASVYNFWEATGGRATLSMGNIVSDLK